MNRSPFRFALTLVALALSVGASAESLRVTLAGDYQPLTASETALPDESFEAVLAQRLGEALERPLLLVNPTDAADLQLGSGSAGAVYYQGVPVALTATEGGITDWAALAGQPFCVTTGSPYAQIVAERFSGQPKTYPSAAHALIGLKLGECKAVVDDQRLLSDIATLPEWRRYKGLVQGDAGFTVNRVASATDPALQTRVNSLISQWKEGGQLGELTQYWVDEVAFQAYVLADTLDCH